MARNPLPRSNFGTSALVERRNAIPTVDLEDAPEVEVTVDDETVMDDPELKIEFEEDGGVVIDFDPVMSAPDTGDFYANLVDNLDDSVVARMSSQLVEDYEANKEGRKDWEDAYRTGLELLGFQYEERSEPFRGATGVTTSFLAGRLVSLFRRSS
jgi:hypothetical protein